MEYRFLGKSGLKISVLGFGGWLNYDTCNDEKETLLYNQMKICMENGINFFDNSEMYGSGTAEKIMGNCLKKLNWLRKDYVLLTKLFKYMPGLNCNFLTRKHLIEGTDSSLERLGVEYVDVLLCHRYDNYTDIKDVCKTMNMLIESGKAFYWGTSQWLPEQIMEAIAVCTQNDYICPIIEQPQYNMLVRKTVENQLVHLHDSYGIGITGFAPLGGGLLTGKYNSGETPHGTRFETKNRPNDLWSKFIKTNKKEKTLKIINDITSFSKQIGCTESQLAIAWAIANKDISSVIVGASTEKQLLENIKSISIYKNWSLDIEKKIELILQNKPKPLMDWRKWGADAPRRKTVTDAAYI